MKKYTREEFNKLSVDELDAIPDSEYMEITSSVKRSCDGCNYLTSALNLWCNNKEAIKTRGTQIPGVIKCAYWEPRISTWQHFRNFFAKFF